MTLLARSTVAMLMVAAMISLAWGGVEIDYQCFGPLSGCPDVIPANCILETGNCQDNSEFNGYYRIGYQHTRCLYMGSGACDTLGTVVSCQTVFLYKSGTLNPCQFGELRCIAETTHLECSNQP